MTDKVSKLLSKMSKADLRRIIGVIEKIANEDFAGLDIKRLKGQQDIYRVRAGDFRIIYSLNGQEPPMILTISRRSEKTYREY